MSKATLTKPAAVPAVVAGTSAAPVAAVAVVTVEQLREAMQALDSSASYDRAAAATLAERTLARYRMHASDAGNRGMLHGVAVLTVNGRAEVLKRMWLDATGYTKAPDKEHKTAAQTSFGQYLSRFGTVGTDERYGIEALATRTPSELTDAYKAIGEANREVKKAKEERDTLKTARDAHAAYAQWLRNQDQPTREAVSRVTATFRNAPGREHFDAFVVALTAAVSE